MVVKVSKELADALKKALSYENGNEDGVLLYHSEMIISDGGFEWTNECEPLNDLSPLELAKILIEGWEVEKSPEEKVREIYNEYVDKMRYAPYETEEVCEIITEVLDALEIKIEGVNV